MEVQERGTDTVNLQPTSVVIKGRREKEKSIRLKEDNFKMRKI